MNAITVGKGSVVLENSAQAALQGLRLFGRSSQNGIPSPVNPLWINNAGDSGTVDEMPNPDACLLNHWMNKWLKKLGKV